MKNYIILVLVFGALLHCSCDSMINSLPTRGDREDIQTEVASDDGASETDSPCYSISGRVNNMFLETDITFLVNGASTKYKFDKGPFCISDLKPGVYEITPVSDITAFTPFSKTVTLKSSNISGLSFFADDITWKRIVESSGKSGISSVMYNAGGGEMVFTGYSSDINRGRQVYVACYKGEEEVWSHVLGGQSDDRGCKVIRDSRDCYALLSNMVSLAPGTDTVSRNMVLHRISSDGIVQNTFIFGGAFSDRAFDISDCGDGYIIAGSSTSFSTEGGEDAVLLKCDYKGKLKWKRVFGTSGDDRCTGICRTEDNLITVSRISDTISGSDQIQVSIRSMSGEVIKSELLYSEDSENPEDVIYYRGKILICGRVDNKYRNSQDGLIVSLNNNLIIEKKIFSGIEGDASFSSMCVTGSGKICAAGFVTNNTASWDRDSALILLSENLDILWEKIFSGNSSNDEINSVALLPSSGFLTGGYLETTQDEKMYLMCLDAEGNGDE